MPLEIARLERRAGARKIGGRAHDAPANARDLAGRQSRIRQHAHAQRDVDALADEVDIAVVEDELDLELRMLGEEAAELRHDLQAGERHSRADPQPADKPGAGAARGELRLVGVRDRELRALVEYLPCLGRAEAAGRTQQQRDAEPLFELRHHLGDGGLADPQLARGRGERTRIDHLDEGLHRGQPVHIHSSQELKLSPQPVYTDRRGMDNSPPATPTGGFHVAPG